MDATDGRCHIGLGDWHDLAHRVSLRGNSDGLGDCWRVSDFAHLLRQRRYHLGKRYQRFSGRVERRLLPRRSNC
jgi:hypothetical protein